ncbi:MAG: hypothetical protein HC888_07360 [Candidatus Competibacteraceae bacterium]|nr:hypothetical protein [Candidatus Competibacteraceae bacterium]
MFSILGTALLLAYPAYTVASILAGENLGGYLARRLLPLTFFMAILGGELCILGEKYKLWTWSLGTAWQTVFEATVSSCLVAVIVVSLNKIEGERVELLRRKEKLAAQRDNFMSVLTQDLKDPLIGADQVLGCPHQWAGRRTGRRAKPGSGACSTFQSRASGHGAEPAIALPL